MEVTLAALKTEELARISTSSLLAALAGAIPLTPAEIYFAARYLLAEHVCQVQSGVCVERTISLAHNGPACTCSTDASDPLPIA